MTELRTIKRALLSVSDKTGLIDLASGLASFGVELISTGGTARTLREAGLDVRDVSDVTGFPEMMDGRVKTLHPKIHGAFLALRDDPEHVAAMRQHDIEPIDMVVVNLYPFEQTVANENVTLDEAVEQIDIGGPAMIRSASKNWRDVAVVTDPRLYPVVIEELRANNGAISLETRRRLATLAYTRTASYDLAISSYLARQLSPDDIDLLEPFNPLGGLVFIEDLEDLEPADEGGGMSERVELELAKVTDLRYGENPHQHAALYRVDAAGTGIADAEQLHGKEMSYNNYLDAEAAWALVADFDELAVAIIKHTNPSGVGTGATNEEAYRKALATDPVSAFGGIVAFNRAVDEAAAAAVAEIFTEVVVAPDYSAGALERLRSKKNLRLLRATLDRRPDGPELEFRQISGGILVQEKDRLDDAEFDLRIASRRQPTDEELKSMHFAWRVAKHVKSNAIVIARPDRTIGVGAGQMNRVDSVRIAAIRAERFGLPLTGAALASDAFFPFRDNIDEAASYGITAIIQPGGSVRDDESIAAANEHGIAMAFTGRRHFKH
ncbi:MAG: bifunctional phosphoribosylaminoimidazolecarboxamide formyltransferase/IMP cyclohydrolase [Pyrinomonadaceae bacterium]